MKELTVLVFVLVLGASQLFAINSKPEKDSNPQLRDQIAVLLEKPQIKLLEQEQQLRAKIEFTINTEGEIVVLNVDSKRQVIESYIKSRLNYKKIKVKASDIKNRVYQISLKIEKPIGA
ncbi:hypothetical protein [Aquimarina sediminis]|uniref:hypothetical protein n=1 Tax=Aquimarina sediminis TaxID=2070536 RepID=UPI000FFF402F|nr:hypothetical protein [Aquimarina sediminis]